MSARDSRLGYRLQVIGYRLQVFTSEKITAIVKETTTISCSDMVGSDLLF